MTYKLEYVISGCGRMQLFHKDMLTDPGVFATYKPLVSEIATTVKNDVREYSKNSEPVLSMLFNAFTEKSFVKPQKGFQLYISFNSSKIL